MRKLLEGIKLLGRLPELFAEDDEVIVCIFDIEEVIQDKLKDVEERLSKLEVEVYRKRLGGKGG